MYNKRQIGSDKEEIAKTYLMDKGYHIIETNFYCRSGEIDLIAYDKEYLVFVEVKYRKSSKNGFPIEAIDRRKIMKISRTAIYYISKVLHTMDIPMRFDVILILDDEIEHIENCFDGLL